MLLQINPEDVKNFIGLSANEVTIIGLLLIALAVTGYFLYKSTQKVNELHELRIEEAKKYAEDLQETFEKVIEQVHKMTLVMELTKYKSNDN